MKILAEDPEGCFRSLFLSSRGGLFIYTEVIGCHSTGGELVFNELSCRSSEALTLSGVSQESYDCRGQQGWAFGRNHHSSTAINDHRWHSAYWGRDDR